MAARVAAFGLGLALLFTPSPASAAKRLETNAGAPFGPVVPRPSSRARLCHPTIPVCAHDTTGTLAPSELHRLRDEAALAYGLVIETLRMPRPMSDGGAGGSSATDVYAVDEPRSVGGASDTEASRPSLRVGRGALDLLEDRDATPSFLLVDVARLKTPGCGLASDLAKGFSMASIDGLDVAESPVLVSGFSQYVADLVAPCPSEARARMVSFQRAPYLALTAGEAGPERLARYLDTERGRGFGAIVPGLFAMATQRRGVVFPHPDEDLGPVHFHDDPSVLQVLSETLADGGGSLENLLLELAIARLLDPIPPLLEWRIPATSLPRRLAVSRAIEPTGSTYVRIDLDRKLAHASVQIDLKWDAGSRFRWAVVELDEKGAVLGTTDVPRLDRVREVTVELRHLDAVAAIVVTGVNVGDPDRPFHPDEPLSLGHGYEVGIYEEGR